MRSTSNELALRLIVLLAVAPKAALAEFTIDLAHPPADAADQAVLANEK